MKLVINFSIFILLCFSGYGQVIEKFSIDNGGANITTGNLQVLYTLGEVNVQEVSVGNIIVSEGFINPLQDNGTLGVINPGLLEGIKIYPNPATTVINLQVVDNIIIEKVELFNVEGKLVLTQTDKLSLIEVDNLSRGVYFLRINALNKTIVKKIIIK